MKPLYKKSKCTGCKYDDYKAWVMAAYDPCCICNKKGSQKVLTDK